MKKVTIALLHELEKFYQCSYIKQKKAVKLAKKKS